MDFTHFQIYYELWSKSFNKPSDPLVLFYHWLLIHSKFKCLVDGEKTEILPERWNSSAEYYDFFYTKYEVHYRLEIYLIGDLLHIQFRRLSDLMDTLQHIKISDYINEADFKNKKYKQTFKNLDEYFKRIQWSVNHVKQKGVANSLQPISSSCSVSSMSSMSSSVRAGSSHSIAAPPLANMARVSSMNSNLSSLSTTTGFTYADIVAQIKQEKQELDNNLELYRRNSTNTHCSTASSLTSTVSTVTASVAGNAKKCHARKNKFKEVPLTANKVINEDETAESTELLKPKSKLAGLNKKDLYDFNPITNYFNYNKNLDVNDDEFVRSSFEKYNLKFCEIKLLDCMKSDMFRDMQPPIQLTKKMQELLNLKQDTKVLKAVKAKKANSTARSRKRNQKSKKISKLKISSDVSISTSINLTALGVKANEEAILPNDLVVANMEADNDADNEAENEADNEPLVDPVSDKADEAVKTAVSNKRKRSVSEQFLPNLNESLNNSCMKNADISVTPLNVSQTRKEEEKPSIKKTPKLKNSIASFFESICKTFESTPNTSKFFSQPVEQAEKENNSSCFETENNRPSKKLKKHEEILTSNLNSDIIKELSPSNMNTTEVTCVTNRTPSPSLSRKENTIRNLIRNTSPQSQEKIVSIAIHNSQPDNSFKILKSPVSITINKETTITRSPIGATSLADILNRSVSVLLAPQIACATITNTTLKTPIKSK